MPRVVCFGFPARGHTAPSLPVIVELVRRGAAVDYHTTRPFHALIKSAGARFVAYPRGCEALLGIAVDTDEHLARSLAVTEDMLPPLVAALDPPPDGGSCRFHRTSMWQATSPGTINISTGRPD